MSAGTVRTLVALSAFWGGMCAAETIVVGDEVQVRPSDIERPARGSTMATVEARFGAPQGRREAVGNPPITRWDYGSFSVFFEKDRVIDAVVTAP